VQGESRVLTQRQKNVVLWLQRRILGLSRHWLAWANLFWGLLFGLPWMAPVLMEAGARGPARTIYTVYSFLCHQLANRSFFLFGPKAMYSYSELQTATPNANTWMGLRAFVGTADLGWKVAWSDRMVSLYGGVLLGGLLYIILRRRIKPLSLRMAALLTLPILVDGSTHWISDLAGLAHGFRYDNGWLASLTGHAFSDGFYAGNALGSFNSWMRLFSGLLFGLAVVWLTYPYIETYFREIRDTLEPRLARRRLGQQPLES
jgi:uncharacterized membrane protein